jgi:hypothetical protein
MRAGHPAVALQAIDHAIALLPPGPLPYAFLRAREVALRAISQAKSPPLPGGYGTGLGRSAKRATCTVQRAGDAAAI